MANPLIQNQAHQSVPLSIQRPPAGHILPLPGQAPPTTLSAPEIAKARQAAQDFEAMAIGQFLAPMFNTVDLSQNLFGGGDGEKTWRPMLTEELAKQIAKAGGIGIADTVLQQMLRTQEQRSPK